jgi:hypothetical protein
MKLTEIIGSATAISPIKGQIAYDYVANLLSNASYITISFDGISDCTSAFCNSFVGKLYMNFDPQLVDSLITFEDLDFDGIWNKKITNARLLGTNENVRLNRCLNIENLILY